MSSMLVEFAARTNDGCWLPVWIHLDGNHQESASRACIEPAGTRFSWISGVLCWEKGKAVRGGSLFPEI